LPHCAQKTKPTAVWQWVRQDLETWSRSINPECQNERSHSSNTCWRDRRSLASGGSWIHTIAKSQPACK
jgi:hypothetical protein